MEAEKQADRLKVDKAILAHARHKPRLKHGFDAAEGPRKAQCKSTDASDMPQSEEASSWSSGDHQTPARSVLLLQELSFEVLAM